MWWNMCLGKIMLTEHRSELGHTKSQTRKDRQGTVTTECAQNKHDSPRARLRMYPEAWTRVEAPAKRPTDTRYCVRDGKQEEGFQNITEVYELGSHEDYKESNRLRKHGTRPRFGGVPEDDRSSLTHLRFCYLLRETALLCGRGYFRIFTVFSVSKSLTLAAIWRQRHLYQITQHVYETNCSMPKHSFSILPSSE